MKDKDQEKLMAVVPCLAEFIEKKAEDFYTKDKEKLNFIISCALNVLGNLVLKHGRAGLVEKENRAAEAINHLIRWFEVALKNEKNIKETH